MTGTRQASGPISAIPAREAPARSSERQRRVARHHRGDAREPMARESLHAVDRALDLLERTRLSAGEFRILLAVRDGERSVSVLAHAFERRPRQLRRTATRLYARGLIRWRHDAETKDALFAITTAGRNAVRPVLTAMGGPP